MGRDADVKNHELGGVIAQLCKGQMQFCIRKTRGTEILGREVKVCRFHVKSEVQTLRTESGVDSF